MKKVEGVKAVVVDTTARALIRTEKDQAPSKEALDRALAKLRCSVKAIERRELPKTVAVYEIKVKGVS